MYNLSDTSSSILCRVCWDSVPERPTGMTVMFYPVGGGTPTKVVTNSVDSVRVGLETGRYNVLVFNQTIQEYSSLSFSGLECWDSVRVTTSDTQTPSWTTLTGFSVEPGELFVSTIEGFEYKGGTLGITLDMTPRQILSKSTISVNLSGASYAMSVRAALSGVPKSYYITSGVVGTEATNVVLEEWRMTGVSGRDGVDGVLQTNVKMYNGGQTRAVGSFVLYLDVTLVDQKTVISSVIPLTASSSSSEVASGTSFGVGPCLEAAVDYSQPVVLPEVKPASSGGGFDPGLSGWDDYHPVDIEF